MKDNKYYYVIKEMTKNEYVSYIGKNYKEYKTYNLSHALEYDYKPNAVKDCEELQDMFKDKNFKVVSRIE